ncbi:conserved membrane hypothetical protein [Candidatus Roizmanbacteria bacterium]|nr:conserved membrane hypothetical protein [Candidatus Roizmanbacteria bacterium]
MMKVNFNFNIKKVFSKKFYRIFFFVFLLGIIVFISRKFLFFEGIILYGENLSSNNYLLYLKDNLRAWGEYTTLGHSNIGFPTTYGNNPIFFVNNGSTIIRWLSFKTILYFIFGNFESKIYILFSIIFPLLGMYYFAKHWFSQLNINKSLIPWLSFISAFLYAFNVHIGYRIFAGHITYNYGFGLLPLYLLFIFKSSEINNRYKKIYILISGIILGTMFWLMPHIMYMLPLIIGFYIILYIFDKKSWILIVNIIISYIIGFLLNIDSWLPALIYKETYPLIDNFFYNLSSYYGSSAASTFYNIITATAMAEKTWFDPNLFERLSKIRLIFPIMASLGFIYSLFLEKDKRKSIFIFFITCIGIIFSMGVNYPFEKLNVFLFENVFLFKPFRDPSKFFMLYVFGLAIFIPYLLILINKISKKLLLFFFILIPIFTIYSNPIFFSGNFNNAIIPFNYPDKYNQLNKFLSKNSGDFRIAIYPNDQRVGNYDWYSKSSNGSPYYNFITSYFPLTKSVANSNRTISDYSSRYLDYLESNLNDDWTIERLGNEKVRYLIIDKSLPGFQIREDTFNKNRNLQKISNINGFSIFEMKKYNNKKIRELSAVYYYGDIKGIKNLPANLALINLGLNKTTDILAKNYSDQIVLFDSNLEDVFYSSLNKYNFSFFPHVRFTKNGTKEFYVPGEYLRDLTLKGISFYNPEIIATNGGNKISKTSNLLKGKYKILLSSLNYENLFTNAIKVTVDNIPITRTNFSKKNNTFEWIDFGEVEIKKDKPAISVENLEDNSFYLDYLLIIPVDQYKKSQKNFYSAIKSKQIITFGESEQFNNDSLKQNQKSIYMFSQSFSPYWKICDRPVFRVNFYGTGVACDNTKNLNPQFKPDFLYKFSIVLSGTFHLLIFWLIIRFLKSEKKHENRS